ASNAKGMDVMHPHLVAFGALPALLVPVLALLPVALADDPSDRGRDGAGTGRGIAVGERLPGLPGLGEAPGPESFELLRDRLLDDRGQIAARHPGSHQRAQP